MFFKRKNRSSTTYARYGRRPVLTSRSSIRSARGTRKSNIQNISFPSLATVKKILILLTALVIAVASSYFFFLSSYFKISKVYIQYDEFQSEDSEFLRYFDNMKGKNILFIKPENDILAAKTAHPELEQLQVQKIFPNTIKINFSEFPITANIEHLVNKKSVEKVLVSSIGMVMYRDTENPNLPYIKVFTTDAAASVPAPDPIPGPDSATAPSSLPLPALPQAIPLPSNEPAISPENLIYILNAVSNFEERFGMKILETQFYPQARELRFKTEKYFTVWLDTQIPFDRQYLKLKKAMSVIDVFKEPIDYIDLRITGTSGEKVIFKRKK